MFSKRPTRPRGRMVLAPVLAAALAVLAIAAGCTSDDPGPVGVGLAEPAPDPAFLSVTLDSIGSMGILDIIDPETPFDRADVLYLGSTEGGDASSILVNYDFSVFDHPDSSYLLPYLVADNVPSVEILLYMLKWYEPHRGLPPPPPDDPTYDPLLRPWPGARKYYHVHALNEPFDIQAYPGSEPDRGAFLSLDPDLAPHEVPIALTCVKGHFVTALLERRRIGIIISEGVGPGGQAGEPGLLGFASKDMRFAGSTLRELGAGTVLGPALRINLENSPEQWMSEDGPIRPPWLVLAPDADISTWHELQEPYTDPDDGIMVRTHLRTYPVLNFDLSSLPSKARINRADLVLVNDTDRSLGHKTILTCSEIPAGFAPQGRTSVNLFDLEPVVSVVFGNATWEPEHLYEHKLSFNVTTSVQRYVNEAYEGERGFLIAAGEAIFPGWRSTPKPDFWFTKWMFHGSAEDDPQKRPRLEITYTLLDGMSAAKEP